MIHCYFCEGNISEGRCIHCGRSIDIDYEIKTKEAQALHRLEKDYKPIRRRSGRRSFWDN